MTLELSDKEARNLLRLLRLTREKARETAASSLANRFDISDAKRSIEVASEMIKRLEFGL